MTNSDINDTDRAALEAFVVNNEDLEKLDALLAELNIFEAIGVVRQELRHSDFLAFLLNPAQNHGLGDIFLKQLLMNVLIRADKPPVSAIEIDVTDLRNVIIQREWRNIDVLIHEPDHKLVCVIENKIGTTEHSGQLQRYREIVTQEFFNHQTIFIYLTPEGDEPSDEAYISFDYSEIANLVDKVRSAHETTLGSDVVTLMAHYSAMLRRHIVSDSEIVELCQKIYRRHKKALDLIFEHRPDLQVELIEQVKELVAQATPEHGFRLGEYIRKTYFYFYYPEWNELTGRLKEQGWKITYWPIYIAFENTPKSLQLVVGIEENPDAVRQVILNHAHQYRKVFKGASRKIGKRPLIWRRDIFSETDYEEPDFDAMVEKLKKEWQRFLSQDLPAIRESIGEINWDEPQK